MRQVNKYVIRILIMLSVCGMLAGCFVPVSPVNFEAQGAAPLTREGCEDLSGKYYEWLPSSSKFDLWFHNDILWSISKRSNQGLADYTPFVWRESFTPKDKEIPGPKEKEFSIIKHIPGKELSFDVYDGEGTLWRKMLIELDPSIAGCRDGALVLRWRQEAGGGDMSLSTQHFGELILKKEPNGDLTFSQWSSSLVYSRFLHQPRVGLGRPLQTWRVKAVRP